MTTKHEGDPVAVDVAALRALLERATPGPWQTSAVRSRADIRLGRDTSTFGIGPDGDALAVVFHDDKTGHGYIDGRLIVAAVNALPALLATAERLAVVEAALEPFVRHGRACGAFGDDPGPFWIMTDEGHRDVPANDFQRARAALNPEHPNHG